MRNSGDAQGSLSAPDLDALRQQIGDAVFEARIAEARSREEILTRLEAATASGASFQEAVQSLGTSTPRSTLRRWFQRWRSLGSPGSWTSRGGRPRSRSGRHAVPHRRMRNSRWGA